METMVHDEFHCTCHEYLAKQTDAYLSISDLETAKSFWADFQSNISHIQEKIGAYEEAERYQKELAAKGLIIQTTIDHVALRKVLGLDEKPEARPSEPAPDVQAPVEPPAYDGHALSRIKRKPADWSQDKIRTIGENPYIHPDSILNTGEITKNYWTWDEIDYLHDMAATTPLGELVRKLPEHTELEIRNVMLAFGIKQPSYLAPTCLEDCLPEHVQDPPLHARLRIFRMKARLTPAQAVSKARFNKTYLQNVENGDETPSQTELSRMAQAYGVTVTELVKTPIADVLPFAKKHTVAQRIRTARVRTGNSAESFAYKLGIQTEQLGKYENGSTVPKKEFYAKIESELEIPAWVIEHADFDRREEPRCGTEPSTDVDVDTTGLSTGENLTRWRNARHMTIQELAHKAGCSDSHIYNIENQRTHPSDEMLIKLAQALGIQPYQLIGANVRQPAAVLKEKARQNRRPDIEAPTSTPERIKMARLQTGLSQQEFSRQADIPLEHVQVLETEGLTGGNGFFYRKACNYLGIKL